MSDKGGPDQPRFSRLPHDRLAGRCRIVHPEIFDKLFARLAQSRPRLVALISFECVRISLKDDPSLHVDKDCNFTMAGYISYVVVYTMGGLPGNKQ